MKKWKGGTNRYYWTERSPQRKKYKSMLKNRRFQVHWKKKRFKK